MSTRRAVVAALTVLLAGGAVGGCSSSQDDAVGDAAERFYSAVADGDGVSACEVLAPASRSELEQAAGRPCPQAVLDEAVPEVGEPDEIEVFGVMAQVRFAGETAFLTRFADGWRVVAAACTPVRSRYDCSIQGA